MSEFGGLRKQEKTQHADTIHENSWEDTDKARQRLSGACIDRSIDNWFLAASQPRRSSQGDSNVTKETKK